MDFADFVDFGVGLCSLSLSAFFHIFTSLLASGEFLLGFFVHTLNGITAAFDFVEICTNTNNGFACGLKALRVFALELGKCFENNELHTKLWHILISLIVLFTPFLREIVITCLTFSISLAFAIFIKVSTHAFRQVCALINVGEFL